MIKGLLASTVRMASDWLYPPVCMACGAATRNGQHVCWDCRARLAWIKDEFCVRCGDPIPGMSGKEFVCSSCNDAAPDFEVARSAARYVPPVDGLLCAFKYEQAVFLREELAEWLYACVCTHYGRVCFDGVTAVPLFPARERDRTYNQSALLGQRVAAWLEVPFEGRVVRRVRATRTQTRLTAAARRRNMAGAFAPMHSQWLRGRTLLLVDDVMTTGATVRQCARALKEGGVARVYVATVARGV